MSHLLNQCTNGKIKLIKVLSQSDESEHIVLDDSTMDSGLARWRLAYGAKAVPPADVLGVLN